MKLNKQTEKLIEMAKETTLRDGEHSNMFFLEKDGKLMVVSMPLPFESDEKDEAAAVLAKLVKEMGVTTYYQIVTGWSLNIMKARREVLVQQKKMLAKKTPEAAKEAMEKIYACAQPPSSNPFKEGMLLVNRFDKKDGSEGVIIPILREGEKVIGFGIADSMEGSRSSRWNIFYKQEVDIR